MKGNVCKDFQGKVQRLFLLWMICLTVLGGMNALQASAASAKKIALNETTLTLEKNRSYFMELKNASGKVTWVSSNKKVATVSASGKVTAVGVGECRIAAKYAGKKYYCAVSVVQPACELSRIRLSVEEAQRYKLTLKNASGNVKWGTTNKAVAVVSSAGVVTAKSAGTCRIYAVYGGQKYYCKVTVNKKAVLSRTSVTLLKKRTSQLALNNAVGTVVWSSSDKTVATVNQNGVITGKKKGTCKIIARYNKKNYVCTVRVYNTNTEWMPAALEKKYAVSSNKGKVVLAGSSSIARWTGAAAAFAPLEVINMGISGSKVEDWIELYPRLIAKYQPEAVVLYVGGNNINGTATGLTGKQTAVLVRKLLTRMRQAMPNTKIYYVAINPAPKYWSVWNEAKICNKYVKQFCSTQKNMYFLNVSSCLLGKDGLPNASYYGSDNLHLNVSGYKFWEKYVAGRVKRDLL